MPVKQVQHTFSRQADFYYKGTWLQLIRLPTLSGTITPVLAGTGLAASVGDVRLDLFIVYLASALMIQMAINILNDYDDFHHGQESFKWQYCHEVNATDKIPMHLIPIVVTILITIAGINGLWLAKESNYLVLVIGAISIFAGIKYTRGRRPFAAIALGEVIAFIFLGIVVPTLAYVVQTNELSLDILLVSFPFGLLIMSMVLTNNIRDIEKDASVRMTLAILLGRRRAVQLLALVFLTTYLAVILLILLRIVSPITLGTLIAVPACLKVLALFRRKRSNEAEMNAMKWAAIHHLIFGILFATSLWL